MFYIENDQIYLTRGDDAVLEVAIQTGEGERYVLQDGDRLTLSVRRQPVETSPVLLEVSSVTGRLLLSHADTEKLGAGRYSADVQLTTAAGERHTVWPLLSGRKRSQAGNYENFIIMPEVTVL